MKVILFSKLFSALMLLSMDTTLAQHHGTPSGAPGGANPPVGPPQGPAPYAGVLNTRSPYEIFLDWVLTAGMAAQQQVSSSCDSAEPRACAACAEHPQGPLRAHR